MRSRIANRQRLWITLRQSRPALRKVLLSWSRRALSVLAVAVFVWSAVALKGFDPLGLGPIRAHLRGRTSRPPRFAARGPYRWVRHPLYACVIVLIWSAPDLTADRLLFDVLWTIWICAGTVWEERDLVAEFGETYEQYRRRVPMLFPWRGFAARTVEP